jgi:hypothetical protein
MEQIAFSGFKVCETGTFGDIDRLGRRFPWEDNVCDRRPLGEIHSVENRFLRGTKGRDTIEPAG